MRTRTLLTPVQVDGAVAMAKALGWYGTPVNEAMVRGRAVGSSWRAWILFDEGRDDFLVRATTGRARYRRARYGDGLGETEVRLASARGGCGRLVLRLPLARALEALTEAGEGFVPVYPLEAR